MKKIFTFCVSLLAALSVFAYDFQSGDLFYNITSSSAPYTVEVTYQDYLSSYKGLTSVIIPETVTYEGTTYSVTSIGSSAFHYCSSLTSITIPNSVTSIGERAFSSSSSLTSMIVENGNTIYDSRENCNAIIETATNTLIAGCQNTIIPNSVTSIGDYAFYDCSSLTSITIPNSVTSIGYAAFANCSSLTSVIIGSNVTSIGVCAFQFCSAVSSIIIPSNVTSIGNWAFGDCSSLTSITIPKTVSNIGINPFAGCSGLSSIVVENGNAIYDSRGNCNAIVETATNTLISGCQNTIIPNDVTSIGSYAFGKCSLIFITIPNSVISIGGNAFADCSFLTSITIPNSVTSIGDYAFDDCSSLTSVTIPNSVTSIGELAFLGCSSLTSITIPNSVTSIEYGTFWGCSSLTSITIPNSVTSIETLALLGCSSLDTIYVEATTPTTLGQNVFEGTPSPLCVIPCGTLAEYEMSRWKNYVEAFVFDDTCEDKWCGDNLYWKYRNGVLTLIGTGDMYDYASDIDVPWYDVHDKITSINIPNGVSKIGSNAFASCISLDEIYVEAAMPPALGNNALASSPSCFIPCGAIATYQSSNWANQVGVFEEVCPAVVKAKVPASWEDDDITVWVWTDGAGTEYPTTKEGDWYVYTHTDTEEFNIIFKSGTGWKDEMYHRTQTVDIKGITENTCLEIQPTTGKATYTIVDCEMMVDTTEYFITYTSTNGNIVTPNKTDVFGANIVSNTYENGVGTITFDGPVTSIGDWAFNGCNYLKSILIPNSVTTIGKKAFSVCNNLASITIGKGVTSIEVGATDCTSLTSIVVDVENPIYDSRENCNAIIETSTNTLIQGCRKTVIPQSVTHIGEQAFYMCEYLSSITIPNGVISIGEDAFYYCKSLTSITIPNSVTSVGLAAFSACDKLTSMVVDAANPVYDSRENCNAIIETATNTLISGCPNTIIPQSVIHIGELAFLLCNISSITIPNSVTSIGKEAFAYCDISSITIPNSVNYIGDGAFQTCGELVQIAIPDRVTTIKHFTFANCSSLTSITIHNAITAIESAAFASCSSLTSVTIPNSVTSIGDGAFESCKALTSIVVDSGNTTYDSRESCNAIIETATNTLIAGCKNTIIPNSITSIDYSAFNGCDSLTSITIPNSVTRIGYCAFRSCSSLSTIDLPNNLTELGYMAFGYCDSLTSITIPKSVTRIAQRAFQSCTSLDTIHVEATTPPALEDSTVFRNTPSPVCVIPCGTLAAYEASDWANYMGEFVEEGCIDPTWQITYTSSNDSIVTPYATDVFGANIVSNTYENGVGTITFDGPVTSIGEEAFYHCTSLASITIPNSVISIGVAAFSNCGSLNFMVIPEGVTTIGSNAFQQCFSLQSIYIPRSVTSIGDAIFIIASMLGTIVVDDSNMVYDSRSNCNAIIETATNTLIAGCQNTVIPNSVATIGNEAFAHCYDLTSITIPNSVTSIGDRAFYVCSSLTSITIPNSVTSIGDYAFSSCSGLTSIVVEGGNATYDSRENCNAIIETATNTLIAGCKNTIIPNSVTSIGADAFYSCKGLTSITIPNSVTSIGEYAFSGCSSLTSITIPNSVTSIGDDAFWGCSSLTSITIPNSVTSIGDWAFCNCSSLTSITIPNSIMSIARAAFYGCSSLDTIHVEATTPPALEDSTVFRNTPSPVCVIPCGTLAAYEASDWAQYVSEFVEEGCAPIQMCGDDLYWEYADGVLTITGTGDMYDYAADTDVPWYDVRGNIKTVSLPDAMTKIGQNAFYKCTNMTTINMPTSLTAIGEKAFAQDTKLTGELTLPASLTTIDERAFFNCKAVTAFHIEATTPPTLQDKAFDYVVSPIHVPCGYGHIYGKHTQWGMLNLEMCELLQDNVYYYPIDGHTARAVTYHSNPTDTIVIPSAVVIGGMPRTVTEVADYAFTDCDNLPAIYFNEGLEHIGERAFVRCYGLKGTITLPTTLTTIGERAFSYCDNVEKYLLQAMTPPTLGADVFTGNNKNALFYISCEAMDDYKVATNWSSLKSRLRDACLNIYHYNTDLGANGVYTTEDTLVASIYYRRQFTPYRWETLYLPFEVDRVTVLEDGVEYDLTAWDIVYGGHYFLAKPDGMLNKEILFGFTDELESHTPYIIQFPDTYYADKLITFYGKESWNKLSTSFEVLSSSAWMQIAGNTTLQDQLLEKPVYMLRSGLDFILQKTTTTLHPFECYVMPYTAQSGAPARMSVRLRDDVATAVESMKGNESRLAYTINGNTLTVYPQGQAFSIYSLNGALIYSCEAGKETVDCELNSGCYLLHAGTEAHKIML